MLGITLPAPIVRPVVIVRVVCGSEFTVINLDRVRVAALSRRRWCRKNKEWCNPKHISISTIWPLTLDARPPKLTRVVDRQLLFAVGGPRAHRQPDPRYSTLSFPTANDASRPITRIIMPAVKIGIQLASLRQPFKKAVQTAARLGADAVEIDARSDPVANDMSRSAVRHVLKLLDDLQLKVCAVGFRTRRGYDVVDQIDQRVGATRRAMKLAHALGAPVVINQVGRVPSDEESDDWKMLVDVLTDLGGFGHRVGALLAAETGTEPGSDLRRLIDRLPAGHLVVNFDPGNLIVNSFSVTDALAALGPYVHHVHAKDGVRDLAQGRGLEVPLGRGTADFSALLGALEEHAYRGCFTIEREHASHPAVEIGQAVEFLRSL